MGYGEGLEAGPHGKGLQWHNESSSDGEGPGATGSSLTGCSPACRWAEAADTALKGWKAGPKVRHGVPHPQALG